MKARFFAMIACFVAFLCASGALWAQIDPSIAIADHGTGQGIYYDSLIELPFLILAVALGIISTRYHVTGALKTGIVYIVAGLVIMSIGHLHMQVEHIWGINIFRSVLGETAGKAIWAMALIISWSMSAYGFRSLTLSSLQDGLTGIGNRRKLDSSLDLELQKVSRNGSIVSFILIDVDFFKRFNDHYGHRAGDRCLTQVAQSLKANAKRATDTVCRYGGEEFAVVLAGTDLEGALELAETLRCSVETLNVEHAKSPFGKVTISAGVSQYIPSDADASMKRLIKNADDALYCAKEKGRNQVQWIATGNH